MKVTMKLLVCLCLAACSGWAGEFRMDSAGVRGGMSAHDPDERFTQVEAFGRLETPWLWNLGPKWSLSPKLDFSAGGLAGRGEVGFIGTVGPILSLRRERVPVSFVLGLSPTIMNRDVYGDKDFGIVFQFTTSAAFEVKLSSRFDAGIRFQHMSNAHLSSHNPGLNMYMLSLAYHF